MVFNSKDSRVYVPKDYIEEEKDDDRKSKRNLVNFLGHFSILYNFLYLLQTTRPNKRECLYLSITFQYSLTFAGNTRSLPKKEASERCSNWVCSGLALKFLDPTGKDFQGQTLCLIGPCYQ